MKIIAVLALFLVSLSTGVASANEDPWLFSLNLNHAAYDTNDIDADGSQTLAYSQGSYRTASWGVGATAAYARTDYRTEDASGRYTISAPTDTALTTYYLPKVPIGKLRVGIDLSLPTGKSSLSSEQLGYALVDDLQSDLLLLRSYGGGANIAPHLSWSVQRGSFAYGLGARYLFTGEYDPTTDISNDNYNPGDRATVVVSLIHDIGESGRILATFSGSTQGADSQRGKDVFRNGDELKAEIRWRHQWDGSFTTNMGVIIDRQNPNRRLVGGGSLQAESGNSNGNIIRAFVESSWRYNRRLAIIGLGGFDQTAANSFDTGDPLYDGGRTKFFIEPGVVYRFSDQMILTGKLRGSFINDKADTYSSVDAAYRLLQVDIGLIHHF